MKYRRKPHPQPLSELAATVYTQVIESLPVLELPHPNPPLIKGSHCVAGVPPVVASGVREQDFPVSPLERRGNLIFFISPLYKGGLRGVKPGSRKKIRFVYTP
jgi:hypothetical protein